MKNRHTLLLTVTLLLALAFAQSALAAGSVTQTLALTPDRTSGTLTFAFTADAANGSVPATATDADITAVIKGMKIERVTTNPGSTAPTALYDITITDADGLDLMGGTLANRDASITESAVPKVATSQNLFGEIRIMGTITLNITNNSVNSAVGTVVLVLGK